MECMPQKVKRKDFREKDMAGWRRKAETNSWIRVLAEEVVIQVTVNSASLNFSCYFELFPLVLVIIS